MSKRRIVIFSTAYAPLVGGAEIAVKEITDRLQDEFDFVLITARINPTLPTREKIGAVEIIRVGTGSRFDKINLWWNGWKYAEQDGKFDATWGIMASYGGLAALRFKKKNPAVKFLLTLQEGDSPAHIYRRAFFIWPWFKQIFTRADQIQAISNYLAEWGKKMGAQCPIDVVPNGVAFLLALSEVEGGKEINSQQKIILSVSRLVPKNGVEDLVRAMSELPQNYILQIIGDGELRPRLEKIITELNLSDRVYLKGEIPNSELPTYYAQADVFCRPSLSEGLGIAFLEAMQMNMPVIATHVGGIPDFLEDGVTGWFCNVCDPHDIAEKIKYVLDDKNMGEVERVKKQAYEMVQKRFNWDVIAEKMKTILFQFD